MTTATIDTLDFIIEDDTDDTDGGKRVRLLINNSIIEPLIDEWALLSNRSKVSTVDVFTCSCGNSGCAGWHYGIKINKRKYSVEWRVLDSPEQRESYNIKRYYKFSRENYSDVTKRLTDYVLTNIDHSMLANLRWYFAYDDDMLTFNELMKTYNRIHKHI